jgi:hypothetical protein
VQPAVARAIVRALREAGHTVIGTDLVDYGSSDSRGGIDFLKQQCAPDGVRSIITNPPYQRAGEFVRHAFTLVPHVVMLVRLAFLESQRRSDILDDGRLARVYPFANRLPMMHRDGWEGPKAPITEVLGPAGVSRGGLRREPRASPSSR